MPLYLLVNKTQQRRNKLSPKVRSFEIIVPMKNYTFLLFILPFFGYQAQSQVNTQYPQAPIEKVTVYLNGAQIARSATVQLELGKNELVFKNLSPNLDKETIQFSTDKGVTIYSVALREKEEPTELNETQKAILKKITVVHSSYAYDSLELAIAASEEDALYSNKEFRKYSELKMIDFKQNMDYYGQKTAELKRLQAKLGKRMKGFRDSISILRKSAEKAGYMKETGGDVVVLLEAQKAEKVVVSLKYYVNNAGWVPSYDFRVKNIQSPMNVKWKASIFQATGENWNKVKLSLSNTNPKVEGTAPVLKTWYINQGPAQTEVDQSEKNTFLRMIRGRVVDGVSGEPVQFARIMADNKTDYAVVSDLNGNFSISTPTTTSILSVSSLGYEIKNTSDLGEKMTIYLDPKVVELEQVEIKSEDKSNAYKPTQGGYGKRAKRASLKTRNRQISRFTVKSKLEDGKADQIPVVEPVQAPASVSFDIKEPYSIPETGKTILVDIADININPDYQYVSVPKIDPTAYLTAQITDWQNLNLLPGKASIYYEDGFIGTTEIETDGNQDTLVLSLGLDRQVSVSRTRIKAKSKKSFLGSNRLVSREFEIKVKNNKNLPIPLLVYDQLPVSTNSEVEIIQKRMDESPVFNDKTGQILWRFTLEPKNEKKVGFGYEVKFGPHNQIYLE